MLPSNRYQKYIPTLQYFNSETVKSTPYVQALQALFPQNKILNDIVAIKGNCNWKDAKVVIIEDTNHDDQLQEIAIRNFINATASDNSFVLLEGVAALKTVHSSDFKRTLICKGWDHMGLHAITGLWNKVGIHFQNELHILSQKKYQLTYKAIKTISINPWEIMRMTEGEREALVAKSKEIDKEFKEIQKRKTQLEIGINYTSDKFYTMSLQRDGSLESTVKACLAELKSENINAALGNLVLIAFLALVAITNSSAAVLQAGIAANNTNPNPLADRKIYVWLGQAHSPQLVDKLQQANEKYIAFTFKNHGTSRESATSSVSMGTNPTPSVLEKRIADAFRKR